MNMSEQAKQVKQTDDEFKSIRELMAFQSSGRAEGLSALISDIREAKRRLDALVKNVREKEIAEEKRLAKIAAEERKRAEEERRRAEAEKAAAEAEAAAIAAAIAAEPVDETVAEPERPARKPEKKPAPVTPAIEAAQAEPSQKPEKKPAQDAPAAPAQPAAQPLVQIKGPRPPKPEKPRRVIDLSQIEDPGKSPIRSRTFGANELRGPVQGSRPPMAAGSRPPMGAKKPGGGGPQYKAPAALPSDKSRPADGKKKDSGKPEEKKGAMSKRTLIRKGYVMPDADGDERMGSRKFKNKKLKPDHIFQPIVIEKAIITTENLTVKILSEKIGKPANEIIKQLMVLGIMTSVNSVVDFPTMELVAGEMGVQIELRLDKTKEEQLADINIAKAAVGGNMIKRQPIVTVMGHVDHGKTSLLDAIRKTSVASNEAGGITQHIGAYTVKAGSERVTFIDTPGHEAFTAMRARGAKVTDVAIIVVAADDGVMPQTIEAVSHVKAAGVPIIVAINKMDKPQADPDRVKQQLSDHGVLPEEWGGDTIMVPVSAKSGAGLDKLLESVLLVAEVQEYKADPGRKAQGTIIEAQLDKGRGPVATVIVQDGTLRPGDTVVAGMATGRVRALLNENGESVKEAGPSVPVVVLGFTDVPSAGDIMYAVAGDGFARELAEERRGKKKAEKVQIIQRGTLEDLVSRAGKAVIKTLNVIIKADTQGSAEAIRAALLRLPQEESRLNVIQDGVGAVNMSDVNFAIPSKSTILAFNVKADGEAKKLSEANGIVIKQYKIIYELIDDVAALLKGLIAPVYAERVEGHAEVRNLFNITGIGVVAGSYVLDGNIKRGSKARVMRGGSVVHEGTLSGLKRFKDDAKEVAAGYECGISVEGFSDFAVGDVIEVFALERKN